NYVLNADFSRMHCLRVKSDAVSQSNINAKKLGRFEIPLCSLEEQEEIVRQTKKTLKLQTSVKDRISELIPSIESLDQSILAKAFRGEFVPQDPNDEPASQLLKRIKQEKASLEAEKKKRGKAGRKKATRKDEAIEMAKKKEPYPVVKNIIKQQGKGLHA
ncbi:MAG: hypothetical protein KAJ45_05650, partial [Desulfobulbaceae bacterium]|nr:hypothetical protein [Desulfobulbaceae bacterium]